MHALTLLCLAAGAMASALTVYEPSVPLITSTVYATSTLTITHCGTSSTCQIPTTTVVTVTTAVSTTICPATEILPAASSLLSFSRPSSSIGLTVDATPFGSLIVSSPVGHEHGEHTAGVANRSKLDSSPVPIIFLPASSSAGETSSAVQATPTLPPAYSTLTILPSVQPLASSSLAQVASSLAASTNVVAGQSSIDQLTIGISASALSSVNVPPPYGAPSAARSSNAIVSISLIVIASAASSFNAIPSAALGSSVSNPTSALSSPAYSASSTIGVISLVVSQTAMPPPAYGVPSSTNALSLMTSQSAALPSASSAMSNLIVPGFTSSSTTAQGDSSSSTATMSLSGYGLPSAVGSSSETTQTQIVIISRTFTRTILTPSNSALITIDTLTAYGIPTLSITASRNATNTTSAYAGPSVFLGKADHLQSASAVSAAALISFLAMMMG